MATTLLLEHKLWSMHGIFTEPEDFFPERFLNSDIDFKGQDFNFIPFGSGRRGCPGILFAITNIEFAIANMVYHFDWSLPGGAEGKKGLDMTEYPGLTVLFLL